MMGKVESYKRLLALAAGQLEASQHNYHNYIHPDFLRLLGEAQEARPARLNSIVAEAEALLANKGFPPRMR